MNFSPRYEWATDYVHKSSEHPSWKDFGGSASRTFRNDFLWQLDNIVKWKQTFAKVHDVDFTFLFNAEKFQRWSDEMNNEGFDPNDDLGYHYMKGGILPTISSNDEYRTGDALMARLFYSYDNRYMITGTVRRDGYSAFGQKILGRYSPQLLSDGYSLMNLFEEVKLVGLWKAKVLMGIKW